MHIIDIIVFLLFTGGVVAFGCSFFKKKGTSEEFGKCHFNSLALINHNVVDAFNRNDAC